MNATENPPRRGRWRRIITLSILTLLVIVGYLIISVVEGVAGAALTAENGLQFSVKFGEALSDLDGPETRPEQIEKMVRAASQERFGSEDVPDAWGNKMSVAVTVRGPKIGVILVGPAPRPWFIFDERRKLEYEFDQQTDQVTTRCLRGYYATGYSFLRKPVATSRSD